MKIDLQMHSTFSDGFWTPTELVEEAKRRDIALMALTDHDLTTGVSEALEVGKKLSVKVITGIELTTRFEGVNLHILGYRFDLKNQTLQDLCAQLRQERRDVIATKIKLINELRKSDGKQQIDADDFFASRGEFVGLGTLFDYVVARGVAETKEEMVGYWGQAKTDLVGVEPSEAIKVIHGAGGLAVLSHPLAPKLSLKKITEDQGAQLEIVRKFKEQGLDGIECFQAGHSTEDTRRSLEMARKLDLFVTGGSDWHGPIERTREQVRLYIPYYVDHIGDVAMPDDIAQKLINTF